MSEPIWKPPTGPLKDHERVAAARRLLDDASPEVRKAILSSALHAELEAARTTYARVYGAEQVYKADLIRANARAVQGAAEGLDAQWAILRDLLDLAALLVQAAGELDVAERVLTQAMGQLAAVCGPWRDAAPDLESGTGLSKYDDADGVERVRQAARRLHDQYMRRADRSP